MKREVFEELDMIGLNYYLMLPIEEVVDGIAHDADMVVVYCNEAMQEVFTNTFEKLYRTFSEEWGVDFFSYIENGTMVTVEDTE